jgi:hypothetical protein
VSLLCDLELFCTVINPDVVISPYTLFNQELRDWVFAHRRWGIRTMSGV